MDFYDSWNFLNNLDMVKIDRISMLQDCLDIKVVKVNESTLKIEDTKELNTRTRVWLELGRVTLDEKTDIVNYHHDTDFDCGADTFEEAIVILAKLVKTKLDSEKLMSSKRRITK